LASEQFALPRLGQQDALAPRLLDISYNDGPLHHKLEDLALDWMASFGSFERVLPRFERLRLAWMHFHPFWTCPSGEMVLLFRIVGEASNRSLLHEVQKVKSQRRARLSGLLPG
jgi:hypothetical protein